MSSFGKALHALRQMTRDPDRHNRSLSQARLGERMGHIMEDKGFSGAAVSNWERGINKISAEDRKVLITLVNVLYVYGGIKTPEDANKLLESGNYRALNKQERDAIFGEIIPVPSVEQAVVDQGTPRSLNSLLIEKFFLLSDADSGLCWLKQKTARLPLGHASLPLSCGKYLIVSLSPQKLCSGSDFGGLRGG